GGHGAGREHQSVAGQRLPSLCVRPLGPALEEAAGARRCGGRALGRRLRPGLSASSRSRAVPQGTAGAVRPVWAGTERREDPTHRVRALRGAEPPPPWPGETAELQLPRLHAQLREDPEGEVHRAATDDAPAVAGQAQGGQGRVVATPARSRSGNGYLLAIRRHGALPVLWGPHERRGPRRVPV